MEKISLGPAQPIHGGLLSVLNGPERGEQVLLRERPLTIGSAPDCELVLSDRTVSRRHLKVTIERGCVVARDLGTTNGSFAHGSRFTEIVLGYGAELRLGRTTLSFMPQPENHGHGNPGHFGDLIGYDSKMQRLFGLLRDAAASDASVLLEGETGTGKELVAQEIHRRSRRARGPFIVFDCGAVPSELIQSAIFGHVKGAFTGAHSDRQGVFAAAHGGTLFIDEIDSLALELQSTLLRPLNSGVVRRVGATREQPVDVRVVVATNQHLIDKVAQGRFRADLFYRLAVLRVRLPPLRERGQDLDLLIDHFVQKFAPGRSLAVSAELRTHLRRYFWPGNVRELRNVIERACLLSKGDSLQIADTFSEELTGPLPARSLLGLPFKKARGQLVAQFERAYLLELLKQHPKNLSEAARAAQLDRHHLRGMIRHHGIKLCPAPAALPLPKCD